MCFNERVSLNTFIFTTFSVLLGLYNQVITIQFALVMMSFCLIQLTEWRIWQDMNNTKSISIYLAICLPIILLIIQPFCGYIYYKYNFNTVIERFGKQFANIIKYIIPLSFWLLISFFIYLYLYLKYIPNVIVAPNGHLSWNLTPFEDNHKVNILIFALYMLSYVLPVILVAPVWFVTLTVMTFVYTMYKWKRYKTWGTMWCLSINVASLIVLLLVFKN